jgi:hypothetical protein
MQSNRRRTAFDLATVDLALSTWQLDTSGNSAIFFEYSEIVQARPSLPQAGEVQPACGKTDST